MDLATYRPDGSLGAGWRGGPLALNAAPERGGSLPRLDEVRAARPAARRPAPSSWWHMRSVSGAHRGENVRDELARGAGRRAMPDAFWRRGGRTAGLAHTPGREMRHTDLVSLMAINGGARPAGCRAGDTSSPGKQLRQTAAHACVTATTRSAVILVA